MFLTTSESFLLGSNRYFTDHLRSTKWMVWCLVSTSSWRLSKITLHLPWSTRLELNVGGGLIVGWMVYEVVWISMIAGSGISDYDISIVILLSSEAKAVWVELSSWVSGWITFSYASSMRTSEFVGLISSLANWRGATRIGLSSDTDDVSETVCGVWWWLIVFCSCSCCGCCLDFWYNLFRCCIRGFVWRWELMLDFWNNYINYCFRGSL